MDKSGLRRARVDVDTNNLGSLDGFLRLVPHFSLYAPVTIAP